LLVEHLPYVRAFLRLRLGVEFRARESVSDVVQSVCLEILAHPQRFDYLSVSAFRAWLCNAALMKLGETARHHRSEKRDVRREQGNAEDLRVSALIAGSMRGPASEAIAREEQERIERVFDLLTEAQRQVLLRSRLLGQSHAEIARDLGMEEATCRKALSRARAAFAVKWEELGFES
jgi:RNA polymerase sigma factor (sigma-70 family)